MINDAKLDKKKSIKANKRRLNTLFRVIKTKF